MPRTVSKRTITAADVEDDSICGDAKSSLLEKVRACRRLVQRWLDPTPTDEEMAAMPWDELIGYQHQIDDAVAAQLRKLDAQAAMKSTMH